MESDDDQERMMAALDDILVPSGPDFELEKPVPSKKMQQGKLA